MQWQQKWNRMFAWITSALSVMKTTRGARRNGRRLKTLPLLLLCAGIVMLAASLTFIDGAGLLYPAAYLLSGALVFASSRLLGLHATVVSGGCCLFLLILGSAFSPSPVSVPIFYRLELLMVCFVHTLWILGITCLILWSEAVRSNAALLSAKAARSDRRCARAVQKGLEAAARLRTQTDESTFQRTTMMAMNSKLQQAQTELQAQYLSLEAANERYATLATTDGMTGLANHRAFQEQLSRHMIRANRSHAPLSLLLLDVDKFKQYNDTFGHPAGDEVLRLIGIILRSVVREGDFPARYGGEEFAVILPDSPSHTAAHVAERIRIAVESEKFPNRPMTISVGVAQIRPGENTPSLIQRSDVALYEAKSAGRNCVVVFQAAMTEAVEQAEDAVPVEPGDLDKRANEENNLWMVEAENAWQVSERGGRRRREDRRKPSAEIAFFLPGFLPSGGVEGILQEPPALILSELLSAMDRRHAQPIGHTERVARYALRLARSLAVQYDEQRESRPLLPRITQGDITDIAYGALVHDIGKSGIPDAILRKSGKLTEDEWRQIRRHPLVGAELISACPLLARALPIVRFHHERWDGTGYPQGLAGEAIPLGARIFALCDTLETLLSDKPYRPRMEFAAARQEIIRASGTQFDPDVVQAFLQIPEEDWMEIDGGSPLLRNSPIVRAA